MIASGRMSYFQDQAYQGAIKFRDRGPFGSFIWTLKYSLTGTHAHQVYGKY